MITAAKIAAKKPPKERRAWKSQKIVLRSSLRELREKLGLTLREVSNCGVDIASIQRAEQGFEITLTHALILAAFYEMPVQDIWQCVDGKKAAK
jgi:transcriptional regulator with XRE-family HTH domain